MARTKASTNSRAKNKDTTANLGFEAKSWAAADALRNNMDAGGRAATFPGCRGCGEVRIPV